MNKNDNDIIFQDDYGFFIHQDVKRNYIYINLPQTQQTVTNTVERISDRKISLNRSELVLVLNLVSMLFRKDDTKQ